MNKVACVFCFLTFLYFRFYCFFSLPHCQSRCGHCGASLPQMFSQGSCPCSGRIWRSTWHAATPTQCPCATATPQLEVAEATTPPYASAWQWNTTPHASHCVICHPTTASMSVCHWPTQRGRKRAERSPFRPTRTVSLWSKLQKRMKTKTERVSEKHFQIKYRLDSIYMYCHVYSILNFI